MRLQADKMIKQNGTGVGMMGGLYHGGHMPIRAPGAAVPRYKVLSELPSKTAKSCLDRDGVRTTIPVHSIFATSDPTCATRLEMLPTTIHASPALGDFTPLSEYQSTTPDTFHGGKPVLHYHGSGAKIWLPKDQQNALPIFPSGSPVSEGDSGEVVSQDDVEVFVNSE